LRFCPRLKVIYSTLSRHAAMRRATLSHKGEGKEKQ
jgi:hypothetical protein